MKPLMDNCWKCQALYGCYYNDFDKCPKIEIAADGLGIPCKPVNNSYIVNIPFGVYMTLKHMLDKYEQLQLVRNPIINGLDMDGDQYAEII